MAKTSISALRHLRALALRCVASSTGAVAKLAEAAYGAIAEVGEKAELSNIAYGTCSTAAAAAEKAITITGNDRWELKTGSVVVVKFSATNTAQNPTFNVGGTGARKVWYNTALITTASLDYAGTANRPMMYMYDGTQYVFISWSADSDTTYSAATTSKAGLMSAADKTKLDGVASGATANTGTVTGPSASTAGGLAAFSDTAGKVLKKAAGAGSATKGIYLNSNGIPTAMTFSVSKDVPSDAKFTDTTYTPASDAPKMDGTAAVGTSAKYAREDHVHPTDTSRAAVSDLTAHTGDTTKHITAAERTAWNAKTSNTGTITGIKMNGASKGTSGVVDLGTVLTAHQDISGKADAGHAHTKDRVGLGNVDNTADADKSVASAAKLTTARTIDGVEFDGSADIVHYGACSTAAGTAAKTVACTGFSLVAGARIAVKFTNANTHASPTLNVNGTGAKEIKRYGTTAPAAYMWCAGAVAEFVYDGANWIMLGGTIGTTTYYGVVKLSSAVDSTSEALAATPKAVKQAYDLAGNRIPLHGAVTIPITGWDSDSTAEYPNYYDLPVTSVTANDRADITIVAGSLGAAADCGLCPVTESLAGAIRIRAAGIPTSPIAAEYWVERV